MIQLPTARTLFSWTPALVLLVSSGCSALGKKKSEAADNAPKRPIGELVEASNKPEPVGQRGRSDLFVDGVLRMGNAQATGDRRLQSAMISNSVKGS